MDTKAYLKRHGWLGTGHSLHPTGRGIKKPLLVSQKMDVLGLGKKKHDAHADQWWARSFDSSLKGIDVNKNEASGVKLGLKAGWSSLDLIKADSQELTANGGLYAGFVKGEGLGGTITKVEIPVDATKRDVKRYGVPDRIFNEYVIDDVSQAATEKLERMQRRRARRARKENKKEQLEITSDSVPLHHFKNGAKPASIVAGADSNRSRAERRQELQGRRQRRALGEACEHQVSSQKNSM